MMLARREVVAGAGVIAVASTAAALQERWTPAVDVAGLVPAGADVLLLHGDDIAARALAAAVRARPRAGRTAEVRIALLGRGGFGDVAGLLDRARNVHVVAVADAAQTLALEIMLLRSGVLLRRSATASGDTLLVAHIGDKRPGVAAGPTRRDLA